MQRKQIFKDFLAKIKIMFQIIGVALLEMFWILENVP
jgi:hypothetical protein